MDHQQDIERTQEAWHAWWKVYYAWLNKEATTEELEKARANYLEARAAHASHHS